MLIKREVLEKIRAGEIDVQFRRWRKATVRPGGTLKTAVGVLSIGRIDPIRAEEVTDAEARRAGFADHADFLRWLDTMKPGELCRIEIGWLGEDPRAALAARGELSAAELDEAAAALRKLDGRGEAWTRATLSAIAAHPGRAAEMLAAEAGQEKAAFKARVRKLKELGLTESLDTGYRLSPRGAAVLAHPGG